MTYINTRTKQSPITASKAEIASPFAQGGAGYLLSVSRQCFWGFFLYLFAYGFRESILCFQFMTELLRVQTIVMSAKLQQFCMRALFGDATILDDENPIGTSNGGEAVSNDE